MQSQLSTPALLFGSMAAGLASALIGPLALLVLSVASRVLGEPPTPYDNGGILVIAAFTFGCIGLVAAAFIGFPALLALRKARWLSLVSATIAGLVAGLSIGAALVLLERFEVVYLFVGALVGAANGFVALKIATWLPMRPNNSLERTREG